MSQAFDPEGHVGQELKKNLIVELRNRFNIGEDAEDVAEYIIVLIVSNKTAEEIISEVKDIADIPIDSNFVSSIYQEIGRLINLGSGSDFQEISSTNHNVRQPESHEQTAQQQLNHKNDTQSVIFDNSSSTLPVSSSHNSIFSDDQDMQDNGYKEPEKSSDALTFSSSVPTGPRGQRHNNFSGRGGINKGSRNGQRKSLNTRNTQAFEKALSMNNGNVTNIKPFVQKSPKGRCSDFPYCKNKNCSLSHPTKVCFAYPNCPNLPGTCNYLHPDQDQDLMSELEKTKKEYKEKKKIESTGTLAICKYGIFCSKELCPFGHPTPANKEAKVLILQWCPQGKTCEDGSCTKAHPSPNYQAPPPEPKPKGPPKIERILEQCKFGTACTNFKCPRRHATTPMPCREGSNCTRLDCYFSHPINELCRFGKECKNRYCMFIHPEGRAVQSNTWTKDQEEASQSTNLRPFAVPDDQVMEQAVQQ